MKLRLAAAALAAALLLAACSGDSADQPAESPAVAPEKSEIVFSDLNWVSAWQQVRIAAFIVEHG